MRRDVLVELSTRGLIRTGINSDVCQVRFSVPYNAPAWTGTNKRAVVLPSHRIPRAEFLKDDRMAERMRATAVT